MKYHLLEPQITRSVFSFAVAWNNSVQNKWIWNLIFLSSFRGFPTNPRGFKASCGPSTCGFAPFCGIFLIRNEQSGLRYRPRTEPRGPRSSALGRRETGATSAPGRISRHPLRCAFQKRVARPSAVCNHFVLQYMHNMIKWNRFTVLHFYWSLSHIYRFLPQLNKVFTRLKIKQCFFKHR